jgi:hypothetical protein
MGSLVRGSWRTYRLLSILSRLRHEDFFISHVAGQDQKDTDYGLNRLVPRIALVAASKKPG